MESSDKKDQNNPEDSNTSKDKKETSNKGEVSIFYEKNIDCIPKFPIIIKQF